MSGPPSDTYYIVNVRSGNVAALADSSDRTPVAAAVKSNQERVKWDVTRANNGTYTIVNIGQKNAAYVAGRSTAGTTVEGSGTRTPWTITPGRVTGQFTISTTDTTKYWNIEDNQDGTPVLLSDNANDKGSAWTFEKA